MSLVCISLSIYHVPDSEQSNTLKLGRNSNNQNPQPNVGGAARYPRDPQYYYLDGSGVFLVDRTLFKVHATLIFGHHQAPTHQAGSLSPMYIEDIIPVLPNSSDHNPIEIPGITTRQFRDYLLILLGRPYDIEYLDLIQSCNDSSKHNKGLCMRYLDIATLARCFGMLKLQEWAIDALGAIFTGSHQADILTKIASENWDSSDVLRLRAFTKGTKITESVLAFIQYLISLSSRDETVRDTMSAPFVGLYHELKTSDTEPVLFGCAFLNILSLGHRSSVWTRGLTRNDRAVLYAAQVQIVDASEALGLDLGWTSAPNFTDCHQFCDGCKTKILKKWDQSFGQFSKDLGSGYPLKDASLLAQLPIHRHAIWESTKHVDWLGGLFRSFRHERETKNPYARRQNSSCSLAVSGLIDTHVQQVFVKATFHYKRITEEL